MADNFYVFETYSSQGLLTATDDGSGSDWVIVDGDYTSSSYDEAVQIYLDGIPDQSGVAGAWIQTKRDVPLLYKTLTIYGTIENARGALGTDYIRGNDLGNILQGDPLDGIGSKDRIFGLGGNDTLYGVGGDDELSGGNGNDRLFGDHDYEAQGQSNFNSGNDWLRGEDGNDFLVGGDGTNTLDGGNDFDTAYYGAYQDYGYGGYYLTCDLENNQVLVHAVDYYDGSEYIIASDMLYNVERVIGTGGNDTMKGRDNFSFGLPGSNTLEGGAGNDVITGGYFNDILYGGDGNDVLDDGYNLQWEQTFLRDQLHGGKGNDTYYVNSPAADVYENANEGRDTIIFAYGNVEFTIAANVERLTLTAFAFNTSVNGNDLANVITGNNTNNTLWGAFGSDRLSGMGGNDTLLGGAGADRLDGGGGNDFLFGGDGNDTINGGQGSDVIAGGLGRDTLSGGTGRDRFDFDTVRDSRAGLQRDTITDFDVLRDTIDLSDIDGNSVAHRKQSFHFIETSFTNIAGQLRFDSGVLQGDTNGDGNADFEVVLTNILSLQADSLIL